MYMSDKELIKEELNILKVNPMVRSISLEFYSVQPFHDFHTFYLLKICEEIEDPGTFFFL